MENTTNNEDSKRTGFYMAGIIGIIASIIAGFGMYINFCYTGYIRDLKIAEVAGAIVSISGLLATMSGLFFVLDNLILQRKSLIKQNQSIENQRTDIDLQRKDIESQTNEFIESNKQYKLQSDTMILQKNENTFFNLVDLHKKLVIDLKNDGFFSSFLEKNLKNTQQYVEMFNQQCFEGFYFTKLNPRFLCSTYNFEKDFRLELFIDNLKETIYFIHNKLDNDFFYHKVFYNTLFPQEKFIAGMAQTLELFGFYKDDSIQGLSFDYSKHYNSIKSYKYYYGYFPILQLDNYGRKKSVHKSVVSVIPFGFKVILLENFMSHHKITLNKVYVIIKQKDTSNEPFVIETTIDKELIDEISFDYTEAVKRIIGLNKFGSFEMKFNFVFNYNERKITVSHYDVLTLYFGDTMSFLNNDESY